MASSTRTTTQPLAGSCSTLYVHFTATNFRSSVVSGRTSEVTPYWYKITEEFPDLNPEVGGTKPMSDAGFKEVAAYMKLRHPVTADFLHHMIEKHEGEMRIVGADRWRKFSATGGPINKACFWWYQFMKKVIASIPDILAAILFSQYFKTMFLS